MYRARWGRLSGVVTSWTLLAASVLVVASSLSRGQAGGGVRGWSSGRLVPMPAGRGHGQHAAQEWARMHVCVCRMRHLRAKEAAGVRAWEAATYACMGCAVERELCSPPLGGQTGYAARRSAGREQMVASK